jgi:hypothetical protein
MADSPSPVPAAPQRHEASLLHYVITSLDEYDEDIDTARLQMTGSIGSPICMAPELWTALEVVYSVSVDVYSWAITIFLPGCRSNADVVLDDGTRWRDPMQLGMAIKK